jgi:hypothetical protein
LLEGATRSSVRLATSLPVNSIRDTPRVFTLNWGQTSVQGRDGLSSLRINSRKTQENGVLSVNSFRAEFVEKYQVPGCDSN